MAENKTKSTDKNVDAFLDGVEPKRRQEDARSLLGMMRGVTGLDPVIWGENMIGFGQYHYRYKSGREGEYFRIGFSPRKASLSIYLMAGFSECQDLLARLGKHRTSVSCLYINKLADVDMQVLEALLQRGFEQMARLYPD